MNVEVWACMIIKPWMQSLIHVLTLVNICWYEGYQITIYNIWIMIYE